ncbi:MAG TPA: hypothetical protein PLW86_15425, partial [Rhodocyclaceae bacterium]|nr:hypothetical protein [Rhodocyclaceae bacterium]
MNKNTFQSEFLQHYLAVGIGALGKKDTDALVMHLLDTYGLPGGSPLAAYPNQEVSALLKAPVAKIKQLRYEAALKYGGRVEDQARARLLRALACAALELEGKKIHLILEDTLVKQWLQGELKNRGLLFDLSFNNELLKVDAKGLFALLAEIFDKAETERFAKAYEQLLAKQTGDALRAEFGKLAKGYAL